MRVLISGAGIAGPTAAYWFAQAGAQVTVVEKAPALLPHGQNIDVHSSALEIVKRMGLFDELKRLNTKEAGTQLIDPAGRPFAPFPVDGAASGTAAYEILRGDLALMLASKTTDHPSVTYRLGTTIKSVIENDDKHVKVELSDSIAHEDYDLLILADGQWSRLRKENFPAESITAVDKNMFTAYFTIPRLPEDNDWWNMYHATDRRIVSTRPDPHGTIRAFFAKMPLNEAEKQAWTKAARGGREAQNAMLVRTFGDAGWCSQRLLSEMVKSPDFYCHAIEQIKMTKWSQGRIVCLGDTAYAPSPLTGAGASLAILGAYTMAGEFSKLGLDAHPAQALKNYEAVFRPFVEDQQKVMSLFPGIIFPTTRWQRWLLQSIFATLSRIVALKFLAKIWPEKEPEVDFVLPSYPVFDSMEKS